MAGGAMTPGSREPADSPLASSVIMAARGRALARRERRRKAALFSAVILLALSGAWFVLSRVKGDERAWAPAVRAPLPFQLAEIGEVAARLETPVLTGFTGEIVWKIEEGSHVEPGAVIVRFDATKAKTDLEEQEKDLFDKEQAVEQARKNLEAVRLKYEYENSNLQAALDLATIARTETYARPTAEEKQKADFALQSSRIKYEQSQREYDSHEDLQRQGYVTEAVLKQKRLGLARVKADYAKEQVLHQLAYAGAGSDTRRLADLAVAEARKNLDMSVFNRDADLAIAQADLDLAQVDLDNFKLNLEQKRREIDQAEVRAPLGGRVAFVDVWKGSSTSLSPIQLGETRNRGQDLCKIVDTAGLRVKVHVCEADVLQLKEGQRASVRLPAYASRTYPARVAEIALVANDKNVELSRLALAKSGEAFVNVVPVWLDFEDLSESDRQAMRLGFTADVRIDCGPDEPVLAVPWCAVKRDAEGRAYVQVRGALGGSDRRAVELGRSDAFRVAVTEGLAEGEEVLVPKSEAARLERARRTAQSEGGEPR